MNFIVSHMCGILICPREGGGEERKGEQQQEEARTIICTLSYPRRWRFQVRLSSKVIILISVDGGIELNS